MAHSATPQDLVILPRDRRFARGQALPRWWYAGNPWRTAVYNALSATFPKGEALFIQSVRQFRHCADARLAREIDSFTAQEAAHGREHLSFNRRAMDAGYDIAPLETILEQRLARTREHPPIVALADTIALEHFTAIASHQNLARRNAFAGVDHDIAALWLWHSVEEIEHKGVAFDTWLAATSHWGRWQRWLVRSRVMLHVSRVFVRDRTFGAIELLRQDGITGIRAWGPLLWELWGWPGMFRRALLPWLRFFLPGFHPWQQDDRWLIGRYAERVADERV